MRIWKYKISYLHDDFKFVLFHTVFLRASQTFLVLIYNNFVPIFEFSFSSSTTDLWTFDCLFLSPLFSEYLIDQIQLWFIVLFSGQSTSNPKNHTLKAESICWGCTSNSQVFMKILAVYFFFDTAFCFNIANSTQSNLKLELIDVISVKYLHKLSITKARAKLNFPKVYIIKYILTKRGVIYTNSLK